MAENEIQDNQPLRAIAHLPKFDGTNHREWNFEIDLVFQHHDLKDVVLGNENTQHFAFSLNTAYFFLFLVCKLILVSLHAAHSLLRCSY
ncbi:hypothetical protein GHT06_015151 [Daphnia sinensis]|uniref:Uncharacterized protein n=1 Tax=Daphnia sinensis TaxID=1820382 RepID=A0AAD5LIL4_9CRUS|nr:hypothetical protein GHT06_015151 [Daphnia sinensis]